MGSDSAPPGPEKSSPAASGHPPLPPHTFSAGPIEVWRDVRSFEPGLAVCGFLRVPGHLSAIRAQFLPGGVDHAQASIT